MRWKSSLGTGAIVLCLFAVFIVCVFWFRKPKPKPNTQVRSITNVLTPDPISEAVLKGAIDTESKTAELYLVNGHAHVGQATRGVMEFNENSSASSVANVYFFHLKTTLPEIDRTKFAYAVWLLRPIPYTFFSPGELVTNEMGEFVMDWQANPGEERSQFTQIIITRQDIGNTTEPQTHVAEGTFGK